MAASAAETRKSKMKSKSYGEVVIKTFNELRQNDELCDFTVTAQGKSIKVHKILLAATSDYFRVMLQGRMRESKEHFVDLKSLTSDALQQIVDFMYSGEMTLNFDNLIEILNAANHLQVKTALDLCSEYMISMLTFSNADEILHIADTYSLERVNQFYTNKVLTSFEEFSRTEQFLQLQSKKLTRYLADDKLVIKSEALLYDIVANWYAHDQSRSEQVEELLSCVRFSLLSESQLTQLQQHWLTARHRSCINFITQGINYHSTASKGHPQIDDKGKIRASEPSLTLIHSGSSYRPFEIFSYNEKEGRFHQLCQDISGARDCRVATVDNFVYMCRVVDCGGGTLLNSMVRFDPRHLKIDGLEPCKQLRIDPALASRGQWLYLFGGTTDQYNNVLDSVECYDIQTNTWMDLLPLPQAVHSHAATVYKDVIYLCGGSGGAEHQLLSSLHMYDPTSQQWKTKCSMQVARRLHVMVTLGELIYVLGGIGTHSFHQQTQIPIESYNPSTNQWTVFSSTLAGRSIGHFLNFRDKIFSIGREHYEATEDDIWEYDTESDTWKLYAKLPRRTDLAHITGVLLHVNFSDDKVAKKVLTDRR